MRRRRTNTKRTQNRCGFMTSTCTQHSFEIHQNKPTANMRMYVCMFITCLYIIYGPDIMHIQCGMTASHNYRPSSAGASIYFSLAVAVETAIEHLKLKLDSESIAEQAYRYRSMVSHLRRTKREELKRGRLCTGPHKELYIPLPRKWLLRGRRN